MPITKAGITPIRKPVTGMAFTKSADQQDCIYVLEEFALGEIVERQPLCIVCIMSAFDSRLLRLTERLRSDQTLRIGRERFTRLSGRKEPKRKDWCSP